ncbi:MAG: diguanylate cyclase, partial [Frankiaceae bacterium]|nr:diguanylate cyclase [Frankiaceae bacterium]
PHAGHVAWLDAWLYDGLTLLGAVLVAVEGRRAPAWRGWLLLAAGMALSAAGDVTFSAIGSPEVSPSAADPLYLAYYPLAYAGLVVLLRSQLRRTPPAVWLDGAAVGLTLAAAAAAVAFGPISGATGGSLPAVLVGLAYPLADLLLLAVVAAGLAVAGWRDGSWLLLAAGLAASAAADTVYLFASANGSYVEGGWTDALWPASVLLIARAARTARTRPAPPQPADASRPLLLPPLACIAAALAILVAGRAPRVPELAVGLAAAALVTVAARFVLTVRQVSALADSRIEARTDPLTGLANRRALIELLDRLIAPAPDAVGRVGLLLIDLDRFKEVNDSLGHLLGDELLVQVAGRLRSTLHPDEELARLGGDEFALVIPAATLEQAEQAAVRLLDALTEPFHVEGLALHVDASVGVAVSPRHATDTTGLLRCADIAMYRAKYLRGRSAVYDAADDDPARQRLQTVEELRTALARDQLVLHYQPQASLPDGQISAVEALVRWCHPETGLRYPDTFLPLVEEAGLMAALTDRVLELALDQILTWQADGLPVLPVAINLSASSTVDTALPDRIAGALAVRDLPGNVLVLEITEQFLMADRARAHAVLTQLRQLGITISIDDFGTGYSSLAYLRDLPVDELKLDRAFIAPLADDARAANLVRSTVDLAHALGLRMVAEGVEDQTTWNELARYGCDHIQGYHLARPMPGPALTHWFQQRQPGGPHIPTQHPSRTPSSAGRTN